MTNPPLISGVGQGRTQGADFAQLPALARRLGVSFQDATPPRHLVLEGAGGVRLHALDWGGDGAPVLFLHGGLLSAQTWDYVCLGLRRRVRAIALDLRGHGDSDRSEDYTFDSNVADVGAVLDALAWPRAHMVGMSYGGNIATHFAATAPRRISSLVTVDVGPGVAFEATAHMRGFVRQFHPSVGPDAMVAAAMRASPSSDRERIVYRMAAMMRRRASGEWDWARDSRLSPDYPALLAKIEEMAIVAERIPVPCLVVRGGRSKIFSDEAAGRFAARFASGEWIAIPDAGHNVQEDNPAGLIAALSRFWPQPVLE